MILNKYLEMLEPIKLNYKNLRNERQKTNNNIVFNSIINNNEISNNNINYKELECLLEDLNLTKEELIIECKNNTILAKVISRQISIKSSRQGIKDEELQINTCNIIANQLGIIIEKLDVNSFRPVKDGRIITKKELKKFNISLNDCLKSFDAKINGKINGWIFAKIIYGNGGHQDNVFEEADSLCNWIITYNKHLDDLYVLLIDTDLDYKFSKLKNKYSNYSNILITNHYDFQLYLIDNYKS